MSVCFSLVYVIGAMLHSRIQLLVSLVRPERSVADRCFVASLNRVLLWNDSVTEALLGMLDATLIGRRFCECRAAEV